MYEDFSFNIFFPATGGVVELKRPTTRGASSKSVTKKYVTLTPMRTVASAAASRVKSPLSDHDMSPGPHPTA